MDANSCQGLELAESLISVSNKLSAHVRLFIACMYFEIIHSRLEFSFRKRDLMGVGSDHFDKGTRRTIDLNAHWLSPWIVKAQN